MEEAQRSCWHSAGRLLLGPQSVHRGSMSSRDESVGLSAVEHRDAGGTEAAFFVDFFLYEPVLKSLLNLLGPPW